MDKIGKNFSRDMEFTGSCDVAVAGSSELIQRLRKRGFGLSSQVKTSDVTFPAAGIRNQLGKSKVVEIELNDEQQKLAKQITGKPWKKLRIEVTNSDTSGEIAFTEEQQKVVASELGLEMMSLIIERQPIETTLE